MMFTRLGTLAGLLCLSYAACMAETPLPYTVERNLLDRIFVLSLNQDELGRSALEVLEQIALGHSSDVAPEAEVRLGIPKGTLQRLDYASASVRAHAYRKIGESNSSEALDFLSKLQPADVGPESSQGIWPAAQIALTNARLSRIDDPRAKAEFLERALTTEEKVYYDGGTWAYWIIDNLCDSGATTSLGIIRRSIRSHLSTSRGESAIRFCEARVEVVSRNPDRVKALGSVLRVDGGAEERLLRWAIYQLEEMHSPAANGELDRFAAEIGKLPISSQRQRLEFLKKRIERSRNSRER